MDAGDSVYGVNSDKRSKVYNPNQEVMITEKVNADSGGTPESEILPSAVKKAVNGSTLSVKLSGLNITERDGTNYSECSGQPLEISLKKRTTSAKKFATPAKENNNMELGIANMPDKGIGHLPSYSFSFKCAERAQKRKQFYLKLKEKLSTKETERAIMLAKLKEAEEAEIKMLRKSLVIKAKPMPSFYFECSPIQMKLKKVPARKAKSPEEAQTRQQQGQSHSNGLHGIVPASVQEATQKVSPEIPLPEERIGRCIRKSHVSRQTPALPGLGP
ncbi:hypothetical protein NL676_033237 [Syzygium grande]|nr:hypothetical protein NL676_033237 [Syzygium grande]